MPGDTELRVPSGVLAREIADEVVILDLNSGSYFGLDAVGARFWQLLSQGLSQDAIHESLCAEYDVAPEQLRADLTRLVADLRRHGLLV